MIATSGIKLLSLSEAAEQLSVGTAAVRAWIVRGCRSATGRMVRLSAVRIGARWKLSQDGIDEFLRELTDHENEPGKPTRRKKDAQAKAEQDAVRRMLGKKG